MATFAELFGRPAAVTADAPGRVNLIGEHTDYNGGFVLPIAIPQRTTVELAPHDGDTVRAASANVDAGAAPGCYRLGAEVPGRGWLDYVQGVTQALGASGRRIGGFDLRVDSRVPLGSGLASSAALEVALLRGLRDAFRLALDDVEVARLGQQVENRFVGAQVGIMDQMAASLADARSALFLDTRTLGWESVPFPPGADLVVIDSGVAHRHAGGDYNLRRAECERACALLGVRQLRDLEEVAATETLPEPLRGRARHVVTENARVREAVAAMRGGDLRRLGALLDASHASLRDDYEVSVPEVDLLVELVREEPGVFGARITGGGFGGSIVALATAGQGREVARRAAGRYRRQSGRYPAVLVPAG